MILAADIGGTKTLIGLFAPGPRGPHLRRAARFPSRDFGAFEEIVAAFLPGARGRIDACAVGVAGPVVDGRSHVVNLPWPVDARALARALGLPRVALLNDLEATAWGIGALRPGRTTALTPRGVRGRAGHGAVIAAGTGLGMALLLWDGRRHVAAASEGGHQTFGPRDVTELELARFLGREHGRVSLDRVVSGPGIAAIYRFLIETGRARESRRLRARLERAGDASAAISAAALDGSDAAARQTLTLFASLYGAAAGDLALVAGATAGVWVGGGIAPRILPLLRGGAFLGAFRDKGRLTPFLERIPVRVVREPRAALFGAAVAAARDLVPAPVVPRRRGHQIEARRRTSR